MTNEEYINHATNEWIKLFKQKSNLNSSDIGNLKNCIKTIIETTIIWKEQQMIEKAIECCIGDFNFFINVNDVNDYIKYIQSQGLKSGDKVKVILIKTEQTIEKGE